MAVGRHIQTFWDEISKSNRELILSAGVDPSQNIIQSMKSSGWTPGPFYADKARASEEAQNVATVDCNLVSVEASLNRTGLRPDERKRPERET